MATETKSGRLVKTPGKFSTCVTGQRKNNKGRKESSLLLSNTDVTDETIPEITSTSLAVNTSLGLNTTDGDDDTTFTAIDEE